MNISKNQQEYLVSMTSKKLGVPEAELRRELQNGTFDRLLGTLPRGDQQKLTAALSNPATAQAVLASPQAKELMRKIFGEKGNTAGGK